MQLVWLKDIATESMMDEYCNRSATNSAPTQGNHPRRKILLPYYGRYSGRAHSLGRSNEEQAFSLVQGFVLPPRSVLFVREQTAVFQNLRTESQAKQEAVLQNLRC